MINRRPSAEALRSQTEFFRQLERGQIAPLYLFEGEEVYLRAQALNRLIDKAVDEAVRDFNVDTVSVAEGDLDKALTLARQMPMISVRRAVVVTGFELINDEQQLEQLKDYFRAPVETTVLVFVSDRLDSRRNISTLLRKACHVVSFDPLDEREAAPRWVADYVARAGCFIELSTAAYLVGMIGTELQRLSCELDKLIAYAGGSGRITRNDIDELVHYSREHSNFELTDALLEGDRRRALTLLDHIFANSSESPQALAPMILGAIASNYRRMLAAKELIRQNAPNSEVAKAVGLPPFKAGYFNEKVRRTETESILSAIERIAEADVALKSSLATPRLQLELLICELCPTKPESRPLPPSRD